MTEQQEKLKELIQTRVALLKEVKELQAEVQKKTETIIRIEGAIEGLQYAGVKLSESQND